MALGLGFQVWGALGPRASQKNPWVFLHEGVGFRVCVLGFRV